MFWLSSPARVDAETKVPVHPGMAIHQAQTACTLGFVETRLRMAITVGRCSGLAVIRDGQQNVVGTVVRTSHDVASAQFATSPPPAVGYQVIALGAHVSATDTLPNGRQLRIAPGVAVQPGLAVCHLQAPAGESCGSVAAVSNGRFVIPGTTVGDRELGGPVYTVAADNSAVLVGLLERDAVGAVEASSWRAVMQQLAADARALSPPQPAVRLVSIAGPRA
ncbi:hypothetical protein A9X01_20055 [Mycobacterium asiaticum]|uniref:Uncharacterized protein n=2 Tax=Mycobacterium asiaticum TaxID=1790 RepID=A0A1A3CC82_MYCAS|nr:hypothetical protein A9X01_20055 [Mycobacterium asiaticum]